MNTPRARRRNAVLRISQLYLFLFKHQMIKRENTMTLLDLQDMEWTDGEAAGGGDSDLSVTSCAGGNGSNLSLLLCDVD